MCGPRTVFAKTEARQNNSWEQQSSSSRSRVYLSTTYLTIRTGDLWEDAHDRADQVKESHGEEKTSNNDNDGGE